MTFFIHENAYGNIVCEMAAILSRGAELIEICIPGKLNIDMGPYRTDPFQVFIITAHFVLADGITTILVDAFMMWLC